MALRKMDINNWLNYDKLFDSEHAAKVAMVRGPNPELYVDYLDGIDDAVLELLETIVDYVTTRFPDMFRADAEYVYIDHLNEKYRIREPFELHPLAVVGLLVHDDVYVLKKGLRDLYYMRGVFLGCPSGWRVQQRIGWPLHQIHDDVPMWKEKLQRSMERFFLNLRPDKAIQRNNLFIQPVGGIFHVVPFDRQPKCTSYEQVHIRTELQSLQRLPRSQANIFTVRTYLTPLTELRKEPEQLEALWDHVRSFPKDIAEYKCHHLWGDVSEEFCREVLGKNDPCIQADGAGGGVKEERLSEKTCPAGF
ncbi:heme-dependent oxidative N-demethylase family protein [Aspergillus stella-maris]|uniref:heme-dependent oxidative N-demethylase family protein n=1 Tax=Aspergillus stella-maris TaxID=1810926 RepID=UPI003CCDB02C